MVVHPRQLRPDDRDGGSDPAPNRKWWIRGVAILVVGSAAAYVLYRAGRTDEWWAYALWGATALGWFWLLVALRIIPAGVIGLGGDELGMVGDVLDSELEGDRLGGAFAPEESRRRVFAITAGLIVLVLATFLSAVVRR